MALKIPRFQQPRSKALAGELAFFIQRWLPVKIEILVSRYKPAGKLFSRLRDAMVSDRLRAVYFPIPKSACTLFATFIAMQSDIKNKFDPAQHTIHSFRHDNDELQLGNLSLLVDPDYYRFTVIRDPFSRLVSAYIDKLVKPIKAGSSWATDDRCGKYSFEQVVDAMSHMSDGQIEKHFRPQISFLRNVPLDHIGIFEDLQSTYAELKARFGIDIETEVATKVKAPKRTQYDEGDNQEYVGNLTARELAALPTIPPAAAFYSDSLRQIVAERYREDVELYESIGHALKLPVAAS